jgi:transforming growth factor-beta-induced protein
MSTVGLTSLLTTINRTNSWDEWNTKPGITCLAPDDGAFGQIGNIQNTASLAALNTALDEHAIDGAQYLTAFKHGDVFTTDAGTKVTVKVDTETGQVWFNDARVVKGNLVVGNGVMHVIDKVGMVPRLCEGMG